MSPSNLPAKPRASSQVQLPALITEAGENASRRFFEFFTAYLEAGGTIEKAQQIAAHESPKTTKLYDRTSDQITLDEIERIAI
jgi:hypothetical protein